MPVLDGLGVLSEMKAKHWTEDIPVIVISEDATDANITEAFEMGISDYILRPFHAKVVLHRVLSTIKTSAKQQALFAMVSKQIYEKDRDQKMMAVILSHIVEFHNGESQSAYSPHQCPDRNTAQKTRYQNRSLSSDT